MCPFRLYLKHSASTHHVAWWVGWKPVPWKFVSQVIVPRRHPCRAQFNWVLSKCKWTPCAHLSKGYFGHLAVSNHDFATLLSISIVVNFCEKNAVKVSHLISAAKNSATLILTAPGWRTGILWKMDYYGTIGVEVSSWEKIFCKIHNLLLKNIH